MYTRFPKPWFPYLRFSFRNISEFRSEMCYKLLTQIIKNHLIYDFFYRAGFALKFVDTVIFSFTFLQGFGLTSKDALNCRLCAAVSIVLDVNPYFISL